MQGMLRLQERFHCLAAEAPLPNMRFVCIAHDSTVHGSNSAWQVKYFALVVLQTSLRVLDSATTV